MKISANNLKKLRKLRKFSRETLSEKSKVSVRQITRLEGDLTSAGTNSRENTVNNLAKALAVEPGVLLGELPMPKSSREGTGERVQVSALLSSEVRLAYGLLKRRYGVNQTTLFNAAPLMFALLAEGSLLWRREKMAEVREAADQLYNSGSGHLSFARFADRVVDRTYDEEHSIMKNDLFGRDVGKDAFEFGSDRSTNNPFADYLREIAQKLDAPDVIEVDETELGRAALEKFPSFNVCAGDLEDISGGSAKASYALECGHVRISDIPDELWADDMADQRAEWLEDKIPENMRGIFDIDLSALFASVTTDEKEADQ